MYKITTPAIMVRDLDLIKDILIKDYTSFEVNDVDGTHDELFKKNPFFLRGSEWKAARATLSPLFTLNRSKQLFPLMQTVVQRLRDHLTKNGSDHVYEANHLAHLFTTENVVKCGFSIDAECFENPKNEFREYGKKIFEPTFWIGMKFLVNMFVPIISKIMKFKFVPEDISQWLATVLEKNLAERKKTPFQHEDVMQWLLAGLEQEKFEEKEAISHAFSFFIEGFETSGIVLSFALHALAKNPDVQQRLREELVEAMQRHNNELTFDAMQEVTYLEATVQGTMEGDSLY